MYLYTALTIDCRQHREVVCQLTTKILLSSNERFEKTLAIMHQELNRLFQFMYSKQQSNGHFNAAESRELLEYIKLYEDMNYVLKETGYSFEINSDYKQLIDCSKSFLQESGGSTIPHDLPKIELLNYEPIFTMRQSISIPTPSTAETRRYQINWWRLLRSSF